MHNEYAKWTAFLMIAFQMEVSVKQGIMGEQLWTMGVEHDDKLTEGPK